MLRCQDNLCRSNYGLTMCTVKDGLINNGIIYGPNGYGNSNFGLAIFDIENHLFAKWKKVHCYVKIWKRFVIERTIL